MYSVDAGVGEYRRNARIKQGVYKDSLKVAPDYDYDLLDRQQGNTRDAKPLAPNV